MGAESVPEADIHKSKKNDPNSCFSVVSDITLFTTAFSENEEMTFSSFSIFSLVL